MCSPCIFGAVTWVVIILCGIPPEIGNGSYSGPSKAISGSIYNYSCNKGFNAFGEFKNNLQVECLNGSFSPDSDHLPVCLPGCHRPHSLKNGNFSNSTAIVESRFLYSAKVEYTCDSGYALYPKENKTLSCNSSGEWKGTIGNCYPICSPAPDLENGFKTITKKIVFNDTLTLELEVLYSCDSDRLMVSEDKLTCQSPGLWSHTFPKCVKECPPIYNTPNGKLVPTYEPVAGRYASGTIIEYMCNEHYLKKEGDNYIIACQEDGTWNSTDLPRCILEFSDAKKCNVSFTFQLTPRKANFIESRKLCQLMGGDLIHQALGFHEVGSAYFSEVKEYSKLPDSPATHFYIGATDLKYEGDFRFVDDTKYDYKNSDISQLVRWNPREPNNEKGKEDCVEIRGVNKLNDRRCGTILFGLCEIKTITCVSETVLPSCEAAPDVKNATLSVEYTNLENDFLSSEASFTYVCDDDLVFVSPEKSKWKCSEKINSSSSTIPQCLPKCPSLYNTTNGKIVPRTELEEGRYVSGTIVDYVCDEFYVETEGDNFTLACQDDGTWNSTAVPRCVLEWSDRRKCNVSYEFSSTPTKANFSTSQKYCRSIGGDLIHQTLGYTEVGSAYFDKIQSFLDDQRIAKRSFDPLIGITDLVEEGIFAFVDNTLFDYENPKISWPYSWSAGEPNNYLGSEDCVQLRKIGALYHFNDIDCSKTNYAICEVKNITCS